MRNRVHSTRTVDLRRFMSSEQSALRESGSNTGSSRVDAA